MLQVLMKAYEETAEDDPCSPYMYAGQFGFQRFLVFVGLICVPWMLIAKPFILHRNNKRKLMVQSRVMYCCLFCSFYIYIYNQ